MTTRELVETVVYITGIPTAVFAWIFVIVGYITASLLCLLWAAVCAFTIEYTKYKYGWFPETKSLFGD